MIRCLVALCAESIIRDAATNQVSAVNILDEINAQAFPILLPKLSCVFLFDRNVAEDPNEADAAVTFALPNLQLYQGQLQLDFQGKQRLRSILILQGFVVPTPGLIRVTVSRGGNVLASWEIPAAAIGGPQLALPIQQPAQPAAQGG